MHFGDRAADNLREAGLENKPWKCTGEGSSGEQPWDRRCWSVTLQSYVCASCAPECRYICWQTSLNARVSLVKNLCEHLLPWKGFRIKAACCSLEFRGLSRSQRGSSFAERMTTLEMVFRGCRKNAVEEEGKGGQGRKGWGGGWGAGREREREHIITIIVSNFSKTQTS